MNRLYVLVSKDLEPIYGCVQGGHAVAQWLLDNKETQSWNNNYLIYLYCDIEKWIFNVAGIRILQIGFKQYRSKCNC